MDATAALEVRLRIDVPAVPEAHRREAERKAEEAYVMSLLRQGDISAGRASELLGIDRWVLGDLMAAHRISPFGEPEPGELERDIAAAERAIRKRRP